MGSTTDYLTPEEATAVATELRRLATLLEEYAEKPNGKGKHSVRLLYGTRKRLGPIIAHVRFVRAREALAR